MDGLSDLLPKQGISETKANKLANTAVTKKEKLAPTLLPNSLAEYAQGEQLTLGQIAYYDKTYAEQQSQIQAEQDNFIVQDTTSTMGNLANIGVQFGAGAVRTGAQILAAPLEVAAQIAQANITQTKAQQKQEKLSGVPTNGILGGKFSSDDGEVQLGQDVTTEGKEGFISNVKENVTKPKNKVIDSARSLVNTTKEDKLISDLGDTYDDATNDFANGDYATGAVKMLAGGVGSILSNPSATIGFLAESLPQMLATSIRTPANIAYGISTAADGIEKFEAEKGREATREEIIQIMAVAGSAAFAENFSAARLLPKKAKKEVAKGVKESIKKVASGAAGEAATEGYQTAAEQVAGTLDISKIDGKEVFTAAAIGGGIGGGISSKSSVAEVLAFGQKNVEALKGKAGKAYLEAQAKAKESSPVKVQTAVNKGDVSGEGLSTAEHVEVLLDPTTIPDDTEARQQRVADINTKLASIEEEIRSDTTMTESQMNARFEEMDALEEQAEMLASTAVGKPSEIMNDIESIEDAPKGDVDAKANLDRVFNSMNTKPGSVTAEQARTAADSAVVTPKQKVQLTQYAELEEAIEAVTATDVNNDIIKGGHGNLGIKQYRTAFNAAQTLGDTKAAAKALEGITKFANRHTAKVVAVTAAFNAVVSGSKEAPALVEQVQASYKLGISKGSNSGEIPLISVMAAEMLALNKAVTQMSGKEFVPTPTETITAQPAKEAKTAPVAKAATKPEVAKDVNSGIERINQLTQALVSARAKVTSSLSKKIAVLDPATSSLAEVQSVLDITSKIAAFNGVQVAPEEDTQVDDFIKADKERAIQTKEAERELSLDEKLDAAQQEEFIDDTAQIEETIPTTDSTAGLREDTEGTRDVETSTEPNVEIATNELRSRKLGIRNPVHTLTDVIKRGVRGVLAKNFKAKVNKANSLHQIENFFDEFNADERIVHDLTAGQKDGMRMLVQLDQGVRTSIRKLFIPIKGKHTTKSGANKGKVTPLIDFNEDMFQYLAGIDGKLDNNVLGFISVGIADFLASDAQKNVYNDADAINTILGRKKSEVVGPKAKALLFEAGIVRNQLAESMGANIMASMGIRATKDADGQLQGNMALALGQMAIAAMMDQGLVSEVRINSNELALVKDAKKAKLGDAAAYTSFIRVTVQPNQNGYVKPSEKVMSVVDTIQKSDAVLTTVFGVINKETGPSFKEPTQVVEDIKGTFQKVNQEVRDVIEKHQKRPHYAKQSGLNVWGFLPEEAKREILGYEDNMLANAHVYHHPTVIGVNNEIERSIENVENFTTKMLGEKAGLASKFFMSHEVWKNGRLGMISNTINLQGDKLHRHLFGMDAWNVTIDPTDEHMVIQAKLAIAEGLGIKVDKNTLGDTLAQYEDLVNSKVIRDAVASIKVVNGKKSVQARTTDRHIDAIMAGVKKGGEKAYTLDALTNLAKMSTTESFEFDLFREIDGITNGVAIGTWQLGAADDAIDMEQRLAKTGIYFEENGGTYGERNQVKGNLDSYEDLSVAWEAAIAPFRDASNTKLISLDALIFGENMDAAISRAMSKNPLMITNYGAAIKGVVSAFAEGVVGDTYKAIAKASNQKELDTIAKRITEVTGSQFTMKFGEHLNKLMTPAQDLALRDYVAETYGSALEAALNSKYKAFQDSRTKVNQAVSIMFDAFNIRYGRALAQAEEAGRVLSNNEREELVLSMYESVPLFNNYFSMKSGNRTEMTLGMKTRKVRQNGVAQFKNRQKYAVPIGEVHPKTGKPVKSDTGYSSINVYEDAGVAPMILAIHGIDAATMVKMLDNQAGLNVHDAYAYGLDVVLDGTKQFNKGFGDVMKELSIVGEVSTAVQDSLAAFAKHADKGMLAEMDALMKKRKLGSVKEYLNQGIADLATIQGDKDATTERVKEISQYHTEGGAKSVSEGQTEDVLDEIVLDNLADTIVEEDIQEELGLIEPTDEQVKYFSDLPAAELANAEVVTKSAKMLVINIAKQLRKDTLNSGVENIDTSNFHDIYSNDVNRLNAMGVFRDLSTMGTKRDTPSHLRNLSDTLSTLSTQILTPIALKLADIQGQETHGVFTNNKIFINNSVGSIENGIQMSANEVYVHEVVHAVTAEGISSASWAARELKKLFKIAESNIKVEDFLNPGTHIGSVDYATELAAAQARYDHIFNNTDGAYLDEFVALGLTNENFMNALSKVDGTTVARNPKTVIDGIRDIFNFFVNALTANITQTGRMKADAKLRALAEQLAGIDHRKKSIIYTAYDKAADFAKSAGAQITKFVVEPLLKFMNSEASRNAKGRVRRIGTRYMRALHNSSFEDYQKVLHRVLGRFKWMRDGILSQLMTETRGRTEINGYMHTLSRMSNKLIDQTRLDIQTKVTAHLNTMFDTDLSKDERNALGRALLKTDAVVLLDDGYTLTDIAELLENPAKLKKEIAKHEAKLVAYGANQHFYRKQAENMGLMMAKGISREHLTLRNAINIATLMDTNGQVVGDVDNAIVTIDTLGSLHALAFTDDAELKASAKVVKKELDVDKELNGVMFMLKEHTDAKNQARQRNFSGGAESLIVKGHTKEILSPDVTVRTATEQELPEYLAQNWTVVKKLKHDPSHPLAGTALYQIVNKDGLLAKYESGVASLTSEKANGTDLMKVRSQLGGTYSEALDDANSVFIAKANLITDMFLPKDTRVERGVTMLTQVHNQNGSVSGYRYMMTEANKVELMGKDDDFALVLGHMQAGVVDKVNSRQINERVVKGLKLDWDENGKEDAADFVTVGPNGNYKEIYAMLPQAMKDDIKAEWGGQEMFVRRDMIRLVFGQRKWSVGQLKRESLEDQKALAQIGTLFNNGIVGLANLFGMHRVRLAEQVWQEVITMVKDAIVIKTVTVTAGNIGSNLILLKTLGVSTKDMVRDHGIAINAAVAYKRDKQKVDVLKRNIKNGFSKNVKRDEVLIDRLNTEITRNPIHTLAEAGIYQSIVEDIDTVDNQFSKASKLEEWAKPGTDLIPQVVKDAGNTVFLGHETRAYKFLRESAQLSDFVARYTLHQHNLKKGMSEADSLDMIVEIFINYDLPTHKAIQYANDMGLLMFTKFFIRIQKVIMRIMKDHPGNVMATVLLQQQFGDFSEILDSSVVGTDLFGKINNPLSLVPSITDIPTVNLVL